MKKIKWGIAGPGIIAQKFADAVGRLECCEITAVASKNPDRALKFAKDFGIPKAYSCYEEMAEDKEVDAVYISTAHPFHHTAAEVFIREGKHILCEKPLCVDFNTAEKLTALARENNVFLMEAMWSAFLPAITSITDDIKNGIIGVPMGMKADFCYSIDLEEDPKLFESKLYGGSLLDVGVYCIYLARRIFGEPEEVTAFSNIQNGVDLHTQMLLKFEKGAIASLSSAIKLEKPYDAYIYGENGCIYVPNFYKADRYTVTYSDGKVEEKVFDSFENGFEWEITECCKCISEGWLESNIHRQADSLAVLKIMDKVRELIGLSF